MDRNWEDEFQHVTDIDIMWEKLKHILAPGVKMYVPLVHLTGFANRKWRHSLPEAVRWYIRKKSMLWKKYINGTVEEKIYKKQISKVQNVVRCHFKKQQNIYGIRILK